MFRPVILLLTTLFLLTGCEKKTGEIHSTIPIAAAIRQIELGGYDGLITFDWDIINTSAERIDGWEIKVNLITSDSLKYNGVFFDYDAPVEAGDTLSFHSYVMFYIDVNNVYPIRLRSDAIGIRSITKQYIRGIIKE